MFDLVKRFMAQWERRGMINDTIKELSKLSNKELNDIGIARGEIYDIAHNSFPKEEFTPTPKNVQVNANMRGFV